MRSAGGPHSPRVMAPSVPLRSPEAIDVLHVRRERGDVGVAVSDELLVEKTIALSAALGALVRALLGFVGGIGFLRREPG